MILYFRLVVKYMFNNGLEIRQKILSVSTMTDYARGINYYKDYVFLLDSNRKENLTQYNFKVESESIDRIYDCTIEVLDTNDIFSTYCDCPKFQESGSCKHIAACINYYYEEMFNKMTPEKLEVFTNKLLSVFENNNKKTKQKTKRFNKEEVKLDVYLNGSVNRYGDSHLDIYIKLGTDKMYLCKDSKLNAFLKALEASERYKFGQKFEYDPDKNYFNNDNQEILNFLMLVKTGSYGYYSNGFRFDGDAKIDRLFKMLSGRKFYLNDKLITEIRKGFPYRSNLQLLDDKYVISFDMDEMALPITSDIKYVQVGNGLFELVENDKLLLANLTTHNLNQLVFQKGKKDSFVSSLLPIVKNGISIDEKIQDIKISRDIKVKLYFDLYRDKVVCNVKFYYDDEIVDYFDTESSVVRNDEFESDVINDLYNYKFVQEKNKILLSGIENIGSFLENDLEHITEKYETYTSEKLKSITIIKKSNVSSTFSIGKDNIMTYSFDLGDIKEDEIVNIFESLKNKKKYYRLKTGDIINLDEDTDLRELEELSNDLNLSKKDLENGMGEIPKYKAIYLDSLRDNKYRIIKTDNLFDELIEKFNKYKDVDIDLSNEDKKILRSYQVQGVKWLFNIDKTGFGGILADEMGLGKSLQTICYIKELLKENKDYKFLIVSPTSLAYNWQNEFLKFGKEIKFKVVAGMRESRRKVFDNLNDVNVIITTYGLLREDREFYDGIIFKTCIIDEAQNIKNPTTGITKTVKSIKADTKLALTGTPIENSLVELWSIFDFIMPGFLGSEENFESRYRVKDFDEDTTNKLNTLNKLIHPFILRRKKKEVITDLPDKIENNIYIELTTEQKKIYLAELEKVQKEMDEILAIEGISKARFLILKLITKLRQICIDPRIVFENYDGGSGKIEEFVRVIKTSVENGHKILVFTSFRSALEIARTELSNNDITSYTIDGSISSKRRIELVEKFNNDKTNVFFIMLKAGGTGLNLTSADVVIHLDLWWNPQAENQATDRAHRIGQKNVVEVIRFISKGTIEEKILSLQEKKKMLSDKVIDENSEAEAFSKLTEKDIKSLLSFENEES